MSTSGTNNNNGDENPRRKGKGRQKVPMVKMENESNLQVTFSKRRTGLFKKASELNGRCGSETALVVYSPAGKPYSFGHPCVETVASRFLAGNDRNFRPPHLDAEHQVLAYAAAELDQAVDELDLAKSRSKELDQIMRQDGRIKKIKESKYLQQLEQLRREVLDFKNGFGGRDQSLPGPTPTVNFLGSNPSFQFDPAQFMSFNQQELPYQFPNVPFDPRIARTSTTNFTAPPTATDQNFTTGSEQSGRHDATGTNDGGAHRDRHE